MLFRECYSLFRKQYEAYINLLRYNAKTVPLLNETSCHEGTMRSRDIVPRVLNLGSRLCVAEFHYTAPTTPQQPSNASLMYSRSGLDVLEKSFSTPRSDHTLCGRKVLTCLDTVTIALWRVRYRRPCAAHKDMLGSSNSATDGGKRSAAGHGCFAVVGLIQ